MNYLVNALASHEVHVARYYMKRGAYVAAANRAQYRAKDLSAGAGERRRVAHSWCKAYDALGMKDLRDDAERVMMKNFPNSKYPDGQTGGQDAVVAESGILKELFDPGTTSDLASLASTRCTLASTRLARCRLRCSGSLWPRVMQSRLSFELGRSRKSSSASGLASASIFFTGRRARHCAPRARRYLAAAWCAECRRPGHFLGHMARRGVVADLLR